jgi:hypothetical protein
MSRKLICAALLGLIASVARGQACAGDSTRDGRPARRIAGGLLSSISLDYNSGVASFNGVNTRISDLKTRVSIISGGNAYNGHTDASGSAYLTPGAGIEVNVHSHARMYASAARRFTHAVSVPGIKDRPFTGTYALLGFNIGFFD